jgi:hypothetical protein
MFLLGTGFASAALAATIHGTAANNVIHGTAKPDTISGFAGNDTIYGLGGNDKLYGGGGNDKLYGGAGNDTLYGGAGTNLLDCGPGKDVAYAGPHDTVRNCETIHRTPAPAPQPTPPPTTTTTPTTAPQPEAGQYCGFTNNSGSLCFDITGSPLVFTNAQWKATYDANDCTPQAGFEVSYTTSGQVPLSSTGEFDFALTSGEEAGTDLNGTVNTTGGASGNLILRSAIDYQGTTYNCSLNLTWTATKQG